MVKVESTKEADDEICFHEIRQFNIKRENDVKIKQESSLLKNITFIDLTQEEPINVKRENIKKPSRKRKLEKIFIDLTNEDEPILPDSKSFKPEKIKILEKENLNSEIELKNQTTIDLIDLGYKSDDEQAQNHKKQIK